MPQKQKAGAMWRLAWGPVADGPHTRTTTRAVNATDHITDTTV